MENAEKNESQKLCKKNENTKNHRKHHFYDSQKINIQENHHFQNMISETHH